MDYIIHLLILICIYLILGQSFNLIFGVAGLFNLAHVAVYAVGAYTTALLSTEFGFGFFACIVYSSLLAGLLALVIGEIALRLEHDYFAIGSLAFSAVVSALLINWKSLTRGVLGIPGIPRPELWGVDFNNIKNFLYLAAAVALAAQIALYIVFRSSFARTLRAQGEFELAAMALNRDTRLTKIFSFFVASCFAGLAGALFAYYLNYIDPSSFALLEMVFVLTIVVVGRPGSFFGLILASVFLVAVLPEGLRFLKIDASILGPMRQLLHALILFIVVYINRARLFPVRRVV